MTAQKAATPATKSASSAAASTPTTAAKPAYSTTTTASGSADVGGTFRSYIAEDGPTIDPRTGLPIPAGGRSMRRRPIWPVLFASLLWFFAVDGRRDGTAFFVGCAGFAGPRGCKYTLELDQARPPAPTDRQWREIVSQFHPMLAENVGGRRSSNSGFEPNLYRSKAQSSPRSSSFARPNSGEHALAGGDFSGTDREAEDQHVLDGDHGTPNEARLALIDTACASCLHSKKWRLAYQRTRPGDYVCSPTNASKVSHFADGGSSGGRLTVWRVPIFLGNVAGEVYSAGIDSGSTPLLLSIPCMQALDMVLLMRRKEVIVEELKLTIPMVVTRTKHLAVTVAFDPKADQYKRRDRPILKGDDVVVYYTEQDPSARASGDLPWAWVFGLKFRVMGNYYFKKTFLLSID